MIRNLSVLSIKDNSPVKKIKCINTLGKYKVKNNCQFKNVVLKSNNRLKGQLSSSILVSSAAPDKVFSGKTKKFENNGAVIIKELNRQNPEMVGSRITGIQFNFSKYKLRKFFVVRCK